MDKSTQSATTGSQQAQEQGKDPQLSAKAACRAFQRTTLLKAQIQNLAVFFFIIWLKILIIYSFKHPTFHPKIVEENNLPRKFLLFSFSSLKHFEEKEIKGQEIKMQGAVGGKDGKWQKGDGVRNRDKIYMAEAHLLYYGTVTMKP